MSRRLPQLAAGKTAGPGLIAALRARTWWESPAVWQRWTGNDNFSGWCEGAARSVVSV